MICYQSDAPDCCYLIKTAPMSCMSPERNLCDIDPTHPLECPYYEPDEMTVAQANYQLRGYFDEVIAKLKEHNEAILYRAYKYGFFYSFVTFSIAILIVLWSIL